MDCVTYVDLDKSICQNCRYCINHSARCGIDPYYDDPPELYCEEDSENFCTEDGCYRYEEVKPDPDEDDWYNFREEQEYNDRWEKDFLLEED